jgi:pentapeptide repeat protein
MASRPRNLREQLGTRWRRAPTDVILLVLAGVIAGLAVGLLFSSKTATGATLLGGVLVAIGSYRTIQVTLEGQITERFTKAVEQLESKDSKGEPRETIVLGGIYAFERIAAQSDRDYGQIMEILTAYVRRRVRRSNAGAGGDKGNAPAWEHEVPNDVQAVLAVLKRRTPIGGELDLDLRATDLRRARLPEAALQSAILFETDLRCAHLEKARLEGAKLQGADLRGADLRCAHVEKAHLEGAKLQEADLRGAHLNGAQLEEACLKGAKARRCRSA